MQGIDFVETPENILLQRKLAGIGTRFIAGLFDALILGALFLVLIILFVSAGSIGLLDLVTGKGGIWLTAILYLLFFLLNWGYFVFFEMIMNGQTVGKRAMGIRVVKVEGGAIAFTDIVIRNFLRVVDGLGGYAVGGICMFFTDKVQRLGDLAAGTVIVIEKPQSYAAREGKNANREWHMEATADALRATQLAPNDLQVLTNYWLRRSELTLPARERLLDQLVRPILAKIGQADPGANVNELEQQLELLMQQIVAANNASDSATSQTAGPS